MGRFTQFFSVPAQYHGYVPGEGAALSEQPDEWVAVNGGWEINRKTRERRRRRGQEEEEREPGLDAMYAAMIPDDQPILDDGTPLGLDVGEIAQAFVSAAAETPRALAKGAGWVYRNPLLNQITPKGVAEGLFNAAYADAAQQGSAGRFVQPAVDIAGLANRRAIDQTVNAGPLADMALWGRENAPPSRPLNEATAQSVANTVAGSVPQTLAILGATALGGPVGGGVTATALAGDQSEEEMIRRGVDPEKAAALSLPAGIAIGALDRLGLEDSLAMGKDGFKWLSYGGAIEGLTEGAQELIQAGTEAAGGVRPGSAGELLDRIGTAITMGGISGTGYAAAGRLSSMATGSPEAARNPALDLAEKEVHQGAPPKKVDYGAGSGSVAPSWDSYSTPAPRHVFTEEVAKRIAADPGLEVVAVESHHFAGQAARLLAMELGVPESLQFSSNNDGLVIALPATQAAFFKKTLDTLIEEHKGTVASEIDRLDPSAPVTLPRVVRIPGEIKFENGRPVGLYETIARTRRDAVDPDAMAWDIVAEQEADYASQSPVLRKIDEFGSKVGSLIASGQTNPDLAPIAPGTFRYDIGNAVAATIQKAAPYIAPFFDEQSQRGGILMPFTPPERLSDPSLSPPMDVHNPSQWAEYTSRGQGLPEYAAQALEKQKYTRAATQLETGLIASEYKRAMRTASKTSGMGVAELNSAGLKYIQGDTSVQLPDALKAPLDQARAYLDRQSQQLIDSGLVPKDQIAKYKANMGTYMYRSYMMHVDPEHARKVYGTPAYKGAVDYLLSTQAHDAQERFDSWTLRAQKLEQQLAATQDPMEQQQLTRRLIRAKGGVTNAQNRLAQIQDPASQATRKQLAEGKIQSLVSEEPGPGQMTADQRFRGLSKQWMKHRKGIPKELQAVMGIADDPMTGFLTVAERAGRSLASARLWEEIDEGGLGKDFFEEPMPGAATKVPSAPKDRYTSPRLREVMDAAFQDAYQDGFVATVNGILKANVTVLNVAGMMRNLESGIFPLLANGHMPGFGKGSGSRAIAAAMVNIRKAGSVAAKDLAVDAARHGVSGTNVDVKDLQSYLTGVLESSNPAIKPVKSVMDTASALYSAGDNVAKVYAWQRERYRYAEAMNLPEDDPRVKQRAAEVVKRTMQNYDRLPKWALELKKSLVVGPFVSFPVSAAQNIAGIVETAREDIRVGMETDNMNLVAAGVTRAGAAAATLTGLASATTLGPQLAKMAGEALGIGMPEPADEEDDKALRQVVPSWLRPAQFVPLGKPENGVAKVIDLSYMNYYGVLIDPLMAILRGEDTADSVSGMFKALAGKVFGEELVLAAYGDLTRGPKEGGPILDEKMSGEVMFWRLWRYAMRNVAPGTARSIWKISQAEEGFDRKTELFSLLGPRVYSIDAETAMPSKYYGLDQSRRALKQAIAAPLRWPTEAALMELQANVEGFKPSMNSVYEEALKTHQAVLRLGVQAPVATEAFAAALDRPGRRALFIYSGTGDPAKAAQAAADLEWQKTRPSVIEKIEAAQKLHLKRWNDKNESATFAERERQRLQLLEWAMKAKQIVNQSVDQSSGPPAAAPGRFSQYLQ